MRRLFLAFAIVMGLVGGAAAQDTDIQATIGAQIKAFQVDDFDQAFEYASPTIQNMFRTPDNFGQMVRNGFPMVWRPSDVRFLELRDIAGAQWQKVMIADAAGAIHFLDYQMIPTESGWKINGVQFLKSTGAGV
jgi:hypothetical protein